MATKTKEIASRLVLKHDIESNWNKTSIFIPKQGDEVIKIPFSFILITKGD